MTLDEAEKMCPFEILMLAREQSNGSFTPQSDALTALHLIAALAKRVIRLEEELESYGLIKSEHDRLD